MGCFSWLRAEHKTKRANITGGDTYKILVPEEFGGGFIRDTYEDYGKVFDSGREGYYEDKDGNRYPSNEFPVNDLYGIHAYWNGCKGMQALTEDYPQTMLDILRNGNTTLQDNRCKGIDIAGYDYQIESVKFPLKLVSLSYKGTYEECPGRSYGDPEQGFYPTYWGGEWDTWNA